MYKDKCKLNDEVINSLGLKLMADLTIHDAALWMVMGIDRDAHEDRCDSDPEYLQHYCDQRYGEAYVLEICGYIQSALATKRIKPTRGADIKTPHLNIDATYISKASWLKWCRIEGYIDQSYLNPESKDPQKGEDKWYVIDQNDPVPILTWYTPARYLARQFVKEDATLLNKRNLLSEKVSKALFSAGIYGRLKGKKFDAGTVLKSFTKVKFK